MASIGSLSVDLLLESASFMSGMKKAAQQSAETSLAIKESIDGAKEAVVGLMEVLAVDWFAEQINKALEYAEAIKKVEEQTGLTGTAIQGFMYAASQAGVATDASQASLVRFTKSLGEAANGNQKLGKTLKDLGVTSADPNQAIKEFSDGLSKVPTQAQRVADVTELFGRNAAGLVPILEEGSTGLDEYTNAAKSLGIVLDNDVVEGSVNAEHKISALKMVINAEWANVIGQNASAIAQLASAFMTAAGAAAHFFSQMNVKALMSLQQNNPLKMDLPTVIAGRLQGKSIDDIQGEARAQLKTTHDGRAALHADLTQRYNTELANGSDKNSTYMVAMLAEREDIARAEAASRHVGGGEGGTNIKLPPLKTRTHKTRTPHDRSPEQQSVFDRAFGEEQLQNISLQEQLAVNPEDKAALQKKALAYSWGSQGADGKWAGGLKDKEIDDNLAAGKYGDKNGALAQSRAKELKDQNDLNGQLEYQLVDRKLAAQQAADALALNQSGLQNQVDLLSGQKDLARTTAEQKTIQDHIIDLQYQQQQNELAATIASAESTAAQKKQAQARLDLLPQLQANAHASNAAQNMSPLAKYLDGIPKSVGEINESLEAATADGLGKFTDGIEAAVAGTGSLGDAFKDLTDTILKGIEKIVLEEIIIKPLGNLISGGLSSIGGGLGSLFGLPAHANGGMASAGLAIVGERGPEVVNFGSNATVTSQAQLSHLSGGGSSGVTVSIGNITSNDPDMVRMMVAQGVAAATPYITKQATDRTLTQARRATL